ncbi:MAG: hypothetical protein K2I93_05685 [Oscillospiraceae bacterium]|nr:hypothetical protein [Oscillospiraceae bacterium]
MTEKQIFVGLAVCLWVLFAAALVRFLVLKKRCTRTVKAVCTECKNFGRGCFEVVWEFEIDGKTYSVQDNLSDRVKIGSFGMLYINPNNAEEFSNNKWKLAVGFSLAAVVLTVFAL